MHACLLGCIRRSLNDRKSSWSFSCVLLWDSCPSINILSIRSTVVGSKFLHSQHIGILWHLNSSPVLQFLVAFRRAAFANTQEQVKEFSIIDRHTQLTFCRKYEHGYNCVLPLFHPIAPTYRTDSKCYWIMLSLIKTVLILTPNESFIQDS